MRFFKDKLTWIVGIRGDYHNQFGFKATPRTLLQYDLQAKTIFWANIGTGCENIFIFQAKSTR